MNIDEVNWKRLIHAYGLATDTPEHLRNLFCADAKLRSSAVFHLESAILHQGTLYPATPVAVKFIINSITELVLKGNEDWAALKDLLLFIKHTGASLIENDINEIIENAVTPSLEETERLNYLLDNYESLDDLEEEEFWTANSSEYWYLQSILDLFNTAKDVIEAIKPFVTNKNTKIAKIAKIAVENWKKAHFEAISVNRKDSR